MAIIVEDGTVVTNANSYVSVAFADNYFEIDEIYFATWDAMSDAEKETRLRWATRVLDQKVIWRGTKTDVDSALRWPRTGVRDRDGNTIDDDEMPVQLMEVTCELAKFLETTDPTTSQGGDALKRIAVDVIEIEYQDGTSQPEAPPIFNQLLRGLGSYPVAGGHMFGKIIKA